MHKTGLVVAHLYDNMQLANHVLQLEDMVGQDRNPSKVYSVHKKAFTLANEHKNQEVSIRKNLQRRAEKELFFGDIIEWSDDKPYGRNNLIYQFTRSKKLFETRCENGKSQIKLEGCIDPSRRNSFWNPNFPCIHIRGENVLALPNVYLEAWISIEVLDDRVVQFDLVNIHGICPTEEQGNVGKAPWNVNNLKYNMITVVEFDDDDELFEDLPPKSDEPLQELYDVLVFAVNDRSFYCDSKPQFRFSLVIFEDLVVSGSYYRIDAIWNRFDEYYMVKRAVMKKDLKNFPIDESGRIRVAVKQSNEFSAAYYSDQLGYVDDPYNVFAVLNISPFAHSSFMVALEDGVPNKSFRFRIVDVIDNKDKMKKFINSFSNSMELKNNHGLAISNNQVFSLQYPQMAFKLPPGLTPPTVGLYIRFDATFNELKNIFEISTWRADESRTPLVAKTMGTSEKIVFKTKGKKIKKKEFNGFFCSEDFGLLDDLGKLKKSGEDEINCTLWVAYAESTPERGMRQSRTIFEIVSFGESTDFLNPPLPQADYDYSSQNYENQPPLDNRLHNEVRNELLSTIPDSLTAACYSPTMSIQGHGQSLRGDQGKASVLNEQLLRHRREKFGSSIFSHSNYSESVPSLNLSLTDSMNRDRESCLERYQNIQRKYQHLENCEEKHCRRECAHITAIIHEVLKDNDFYKQLRFYFPEIAENLKQRVYISEKHWH